MLNREQAKAIIDVLLTTAAGDARPEASRLYGLLGIFSKIDTAERAGELDAAQAEFQRQRAVDAITQLLGGSR